MQRILACIQGLRDVKGKDGATNQFLGILRIIEGDGGISTNTFELQEITLALLWLGYEGLLIDGRTMKVTVTHLAIAIVVVEVMGKVDAHDRIVSHRTESSPSLV